jgi:Dyp-type peroxidase family
MAAVALNNHFDQEATVLELGDIQGIVFSGYQNKSEASYLLLQVIEPAKARQWLRSIAQLVTSGVDRSPDTCLNVAWTARGLAALGLGDDGLHTFPLEFREGLSGSDTRSRTLGDCDESAPSSWSWGGSDTPVDALLMLYGRSPDVLRALIDGQQAAMQGALRCVAELHTKTLPERREHFGFADGIAQPVIEGSGREVPAGARSLKAGEFILGYENEYGKLPFVPNVAPALDAGGQLADCSAEGKRKALGRNGSYLVVRQLKQDVHGFWTCMRAAAEAESPGRTVGDRAIALGAKCVGRWPSGAPLALAPDHDEPARGSSNDFGYLRDDEHGLRCPIGAHIRRTNPRDSLEGGASESYKVVDRHSIIRRGRSYGAMLADRPWLAERDDDQERGLVFMCLNANIRRQFEFMQQTWVNNPKFGGLYDERDPLIGARDADANGFTIPDQPARRRLDALPRFVSVRGGGYFFLPSLRALKFLASLPSAQNA